MQLWGTSARASVACNISFLTGLFLLELRSHFHVSSRVLARLKAGRSDLFIFLSYAVMPVRVQNDSKTRHGGLLPRY